MKIEELYKLLIQKYKKYISEIEEIPCYLGFGPAYKEFYITKSPLTIIKIIQVGRKKCFEFFIQNNNGEGAMISSKMEGSKVIDLVDLIMGE